MEVEITWHLVMMLIFSVTIIMQMGRGLEEDGLDFSFMFWLIILVVVWSIYGGIVWW